MVKEATSIIQSVNGQKTQSTESIIVHCDCLELYKCHYPTDKNQEQES